MPKKTAKPKLGLPLIAFGSFLIIVFGGYKFYAARILSFNTTPPIQIITEGSQPIVIDIAKVNIHLPITETKVVNNTWEIAKNSASHWDSSANPGELGNIVIYAHNKKALFGSIRWLKPGDEIIITDSNDGKHQYFVTQTVTVSPNQTDYIAPKNSETLTLYTCTGLFDSQRYLVIAEPN